MSEALARIDQTSVEAYEKALILGDLAGLKPEERVNYYRAVCKSVGLNPLTKPFEYTLLNGKLLLYAKRDATDQLRKIHGVSVTSLSVKIEDGIAVATCHVTDSEGRTDVATGVLSIQGLKGVDLANAMMKVETKAKRRATLSIVGLGLLDETELETIRQDETEPARQSRREVERGTLEVSREQNRGHGNEGFATVLENPLPPADYEKIKTDTLSHIRTAEGTVVGDSVPVNKPEERARPTSDKPAPEITPLETAVLDAEVGTTRLSPKQISENKTLPEEKQHVGAPYYRIKCIGDTLLYVYDQHLFRAVLQAKGRKKAGFMVQRGTKGLLQIKDVIHVDGVKFARDPITKDAIPADILAATEKVINSPAVPNEQETAKPASTQTAFPLGANMRSITAEIASYSDTDSVDGHPLKTKSGKPFCTVKVKHLESNPKHDPHATFQCFKEALFGSLRAGVGKKFSWDYSVAITPDGRVWQSIESLAAEDQSQEGVF